MLLIRVILRLMVLVVSIVTLVAASSLALGRALNGDVLAFVSNRERWSDIYLMDVRSRLVYDLSNDRAAGIWETAWSADGKQLAYVRVVLREQLGVNYVAYVLDASHSLEASRRHARRLPGNASSITTPVWSPDGSRVAYLVNHESDYHLYVSDSRSQSLDTLSVGTDRFTWSETMGILYVTELEDGQRWGVRAIELKPGRPEAVIQTLVEVEPSLGPSPSLVAWSPDSTRMAFQPRMISRKELYPIYIMHLPAGTVYQVTEGFSPNVPIVWSPDASRIAFVSEHTGQMDIYVTDVPDSPDAGIATVYNLTRSDAQDWNPVWSPDGSRITFVSDRDGNWEIYVMDADGNNVRNLTRNPADDSSPAWRP